MEFYMYKSKQEHSFTVVIKILIHPLSTERHTPRCYGTSNKKITKILLHMFIVELAPKNNNEEIYDVKTALK